MGMAIKIGGLTIPGSHGSGSWSSYWLTLISAIIANTDRDAIVLTFPSAQTSLTDTDFTVTVNGVARAVSSASWMGAAITLVLASDVTPGDVVVVTFVKTGDTSNVTNNVEIWYGIQIDESNSSPDVTRIASTVGEMTLHASLPVHANLKACLLADAGTVNYYLDPTDWTKQVGGAASALDGSAGQVMIEWGAFYYKVDNPSAGIQQVKISLYPCTGFTLVPKHYISAYEANITRSTSKLGSFKNTGTDYRGGNNNAAWDAAANTLLGMPVTDINRTNGRTYARNRGTGWNQYGYNDHKWLFWFFAIEYATLNSQKAVNATLTAEGYKQGGLGGGVSTAVASVWNTFNGYNPFVPCGASDSLASGSGEYTYTKEDFGGAGVDVNFTVNRYRGHEMPFGHIWKICDGINIDIKTVGDGVASSLYSADDPSIWTDANYTGYTNRGNIARANNWLNKALMGAGAEILPRTDGCAATGNTVYYCDYFYTSVTGSSMRMLLVGGDADRGTRGGLAYSGTNSVPAAAATHVGFRTRFQGA